MPQGTYPEDECFFAAVYVVQNVCMFIKNCISTGNKYNLGW